MSDIKRMFWDIETSPNIGLFWKSGYKVNIPPENIIQEKKIICICWKWEGHKRVFSLTWDKGDDEQMIGEFLPVLEEADEAVAHNGDHFDLKWFNAQAMQYGMSVPPDTRTVDTLVIARRRFYLNSNRLDYIANLLFGEGKTKTSFDMWRKILLDNDPVALKAMVEYCREDVRLLERVYEKISPFHAPKTHVGVLQGRERWSCAHCGSYDMRRKKRRPTAKGMVQHSMLCLDCRKHCTLSDWAYKKLTGRSVTL